MARMERQPKTIKAQIPGMSRSMVNSIFGAVNALDGRSSDYASSTEIRECRALYEFSGYSRRLVDFLVTSVLGAEGITFDVRRGPRTRADRLQRRWDEFRESPDVSGEYDLRGLTGAMMAAAFTDGESFLIMDNVDGEFKVALMPRDMLADWDKYGTWQKGTDSIERDSMLRPISYEFKEIGVVPADRVIHFYDVERSKHMRGIPLMRPAVTSLKRLDSLSRAFSSNAIGLAALNSILVLPDELIMANEVSDPDEDPDADVTASTLDSIVIKLPDFQDGQIAVLPSSQVPANRDLWINLDRNLHGAEIQSEKESLKREAAGALGIHYSRAASDLKSVNFSTGMMAALDDQARIGHLQNLIVRLERSLLYQVWSMMASRPAWDSLVIRTVKPVAASIDPAKQAAANKINVETKVTSRRRIIEAAGEDPDQVFAEIEEEEAMFGETETVQIGNDF